VGVGIEVTNLNAWYGNNHTLQDINLNIPANHATALIGPSGCGKSTFVRCLNRMHETNPIARVTGTVRIGEIDIYTTPQFKEAVSAAIDGGAHTIVINMRKVSYMDSSGFGTLLSATKRLRPYNGSLCLCCCNEAITRMLQITRLDSIFGVCDTEAEAVNLAKTSAGAISKEAAVAVAA